MSEQAQHTPGPLVVHPEVAWICPEDNLDAPVAKLCWPTELRSERETFCNGLLFAAAPDLLAALEDARTYIDAVVFNAGPGKKQDNYMACLHRIDAAIAKARGQS